MIKEILVSEYGKVLEFIKQDNARNYFIRLGLESDKSVYEKIIGEWDHDEKLKAVFFKRQSGNLQFYGRDDFDVDGFAGYISKMNFKSLIGPSSYCDHFLKKNLFTDYTNGAIIGKLGSEENTITYQLSPEIEILNIGDLDEVVELYEKVFNGFSSKAVMEEKIKRGRGRGLCIRDKGKIISVVQSEFETQQSAVIVGVATDPAFQGMGLASKCLKVLCGQLLEEGKELYLQYDNMDAGRIYEMIGFKPIDQIKHYLR